MSRIYSFVGVHFRQRKCDRLQLCCQIAYNFTVRIVNISTIKKNFKDNEFYHHFAFFLMFSAKWVRFPCLSISKSSKLFFFSR